MSAKRFGALVRCLEGLRGKFVIGEQKRELIKDFTIYTASLCNRMKLPFEYSCRFNYKLLMSARNKLFQSLVKTVSQVRSASISTKGLNRDGSIARLALRYHCLHLIEVRAAA